MSSALDQILLIPGIGRRSFTGLLDLYPGAAAAYSLRKLRADYSGACLRVRRSSDSAEQDIGFVNNVLDTSALSSFCSGANGLLVRVYDQVGSNNATQSTAGSQPIIFNSETGVVVNEFGKPAWNNVDASGSAIAHFLAMAPWHTASQGYVGLFTVYSMSITGSFPCVQNSSPVDRGLLSIHTSEAITRTGTIRSVTNINNGSPIGLNTTLVRHDYADRTRVKTFLNKTATADIDIADSNTNFNMPTEYWIGNANTPIVIANMRFSELLFYAVDQTANELAIRSNQFDFWRSA